MEPHICDYFRFSHLESNYFSPGNTELRDHDCDYNSADSDSKDTHKRYACASWSVLYINIFLASSFHRATYIICLTINFDLFLLRCLGSSRNQWKQVITFLF